MSGEPFREKPLVSPKVAMMTGKVRRGARAVSQETCLDTVALLSRGRREGCEIVAAASRLETEAPTVEARGKS